MESRLARQAASRRVVADFPAFDHAFVSRETSGFGRQGAPRVVFGAIFGATIVLKRFQRHFATGEIARNDAIGDFRAGKAPRDEAIGDFRAGKVPKMMRGSFFEHAWRG